MMFQLFIVLVLTLVGSSDCEKQISKLLLISLDGFRWDYLQVASKYNIETPNFNFLMSTGTHSIVRPSYISITFPSHMSIVSGLYPESHGVVGHIMDDPKLGHFKGYKSGNLESDQVLDPKWMDVGAEPIWVTNQKNGGLNSHYSGCYFWPGCGTKFQNQLPSFYERFAKEETIYEKRVDTVVKWFVENGVNLGLLYIEEPDHTGHQYGPTSKELAVVVGVLDKLIGYLIRQLKQHNLFDVMNIIITSDHGMTDLIDPSKKMIELDKFLSRDSYTSNFLWPVRPIWPKPGTQEVVVKKLKSIPYLTVYERDTIPEEYHFRNHPRIAPVQIESDPGVFLLFDYKEFVENKKKANAAINKGGHGWTNKFKDMLNIFIAHGPMFRQNYKSDIIFENVNIYPLMCHILEITSAPNNGSLRNVQHLLASRGRFTGPKTTTKMLLWMVVSFFVVVYGVYVLCRPNCQRYCDYKPCDGLQFSCHGLRSKWLVPGLITAYMIYTLYALEPTISLPF